MSAQLLGGLLLYNPCILGVCLGVHIVGISLCCECYLQLNNFFNQGSWGWGGQPSVPPVNLFRVFICSVPHSSAPADKRRWDNCVIWHMVCGKENYLASKSPYTCTFIIRLLGLRTEHLFN